MKHLRSSHANTNGPNHEYARSQSRGCYEFPPSTPLHSCLCSLNLACIRYTGDIPVYGLPGDGRERGWSGLLDIKLCTQCNTCFPHEVFTRSASIRKRASSSNHFNKTYSIDEKDYKPVRIRILNGELESAATGLGIIEANVERREFSISARLAICVKRWLSLEHMYFHIFVVTTDKGWVYSPLISNDSENNCTALLHNFHGCREQTHSPRLIP